MTSRSKTVRAVRFTLTVAALAFFFGALFSADWTALQTLELVQSFAIPILVASVVLSGLAFWAIGSESGGKIGPFILMQIESWIIRYLPGPSQVASKFVRLVEAGQSKSKAASITYQDVLTNVLSSALISGLMIVVFVLGAPKGTVPLLTALIIIVLVAVSVLITLFLKPFGLALFFATFGRIVFIAGVWVALPESVKLEGNVWIVPYLYLASAVVGYLAVFVPGGLGVRETAFIALCTTFGVLDVASAAGLAALLRLVTLMTDATLAVVFWRAIRIKLRGKESGNA